MDTGKIMLKNFIKKYGRGELRKLTDYFLMRKSNEEIGAYFGVTRQRVHQWQRAFTNTRTDLKSFVSKTIKDKS